MCRLLNIHIAYAVAAAQRKLGRGIVVGVALKWEYESASEYLSRLAVGSKFSFFCSSAPRRGENAC